MDDQNKRPDGTQDAYDLLSRNFSSFGTPVQGQQEDDVKNSGEIYFSANSDTASNRSAGTANRRSDIVLPEEDLYEKIMNSRPSASSARSASATGRNANYGSSGRTASQAGRASSQQGRTASQMGRTAPQAGRNASQTSRTVPQAGRLSSAAGKKNAAAKTSAAVASGSAKKNQGKKKKRKQSNVMLTVGIVVFVIIAAMLIRIPIMGCINDILAINADTTQIRVVITDNMDVDDVINILGKKKLINSTGFCKLAARFLSYDKKSDNTLREYHAGEYNLSSSMGLEGMLNEILAAGSTDSTVKLTFPEGYTVSQIAAKLSSNGVCSTAEFYAAMNDRELLKEYDFLSDITDASLRYKLLEGYMYPDTYEFYIDETPKSVVKRFLDNFQSKWDDMFAEKAKKSNYSIDEILTVASILEREAENSEQMPAIASVIYNRLGSSSFPYINCDSTAKYINAYEEELTAKGTYANYLKVYDTYQKTGLPVGPICNPGKQAINAALSPDSTTYYYFLHDKDGKLYLASTQSEHDRNKQTAGIEN